MNYRTIKRLQKEIKELRAAQAAQSNTDKQTCCTIGQLIINKSAELDEITAAIPNTYEGNIIILKLNNQSWKSIAQTVTGSVNNHNAIRAMIRRYNW